MHALLESQIFSGGQGHTGRGNSLYGRVVCQVQEKNRTVDGACFTEGLLEEVRFLEGNAHGGKYYGEFLILAADLCLTGNLSSQLGVGQTGSRENRQLLAPDQGVQAVDGGDTGLNELGRVLPGGGVHGQAVDIHPFIRDDFRSVIDDISHAVEDTAQHIFRYAELHHAAEKSDF